MRWLTVLHAYWLRLLEHVRADAGPVPRRDDPGVWEAALAIADADPADRWEIVCGYRESGYADLAEIANAAVIALLGAGLILQQAEQRARLEGEG